MSTELPAAARQASEKAVLQAIEDSKAPQAQQEGSSAGEQADGSSGEAGAAQTADGSDNKVTTVFDDQQHFVSCSPVFPGQLP